MNDWIGKNVSFFKDPIAREELAIRGGKPTYMGQFTKITKTKTAFGLPAYECEIKGASGKKVRICSISQYMRLCEDNPKEKMTQKQFKEWFEDDR